MPKKTRIPSVFFLSRSEITKKKGAQYFALLLIITVIKLLISSRISTKDAAESIRNNRSRSRSYNCSHSHF